MASEIQQAILKKIEEYDTIMLFRHIRMDGDCVGATKGLKRILQLTYPEIILRSWVRMMSRWQMTFAAARWGS